MHDAPPTPAGPPDLSLFLYQDGQPPLTESQAQQEARLLSRELAPQEVEIRDKSNDDIKLLEEFMEEYESRLAKRAWKQFNDDGSPSESS